MLGVWVGVEGGIDICLDMVHLPPTDNVESREAVFARAREEFTRMCESLSIENGGELFDQARASPSGSAVRVVSWRKALLVVSALSLPLVLFEVLRQAAAGWRQWRRWRIEQRERRRALCTNCAYDLSGLPPGRCPECGAATSSA